MTTNTKVNIAGILLSLAFLCLDLSIELGVAGGVPYIAVVLIGLFSTQKKYFHVACASGVILTISGYLLSPPGGEEWKVILNRAYAIFAIMATAFVSNKVNRIKNQLNEAKKTLESKVEERIKELNIMLEKQNFLSSIIADTQQAVIGSDLEGNVVSWNMGAESLYGHTIEEAIDNNLSILYPNDQKGELKIILAKIRTDKLLKNIEVIHLHKDGNPINVSSTISQVKNLKGELIGASFIETDISDRKEIEASLLMEKARTQAILENVVDGIITIDESGVIQTYNPAAVNIFGYKPEEVIGKNVRMLMPDPYRKEHDQYVENYLKTGKAQIIGIGREVVGLRKDGTEFPLELAISEAWVEDQRIFTGIVRDISDRKEKEAELLRTRKDAEKANQAKSTFLANMSHEIRTPLNAILGYAQVLCRDDSLKADQKESIETINMSGNHLLGLINDVLDISKIESGVIDLKPVDFDLGALSNDLKKMFQARCDEKDLQLNIEEFHQGDLLVNGDESKLKQVLINLIGNAVKFTDSGEIEFKLTPEGNEHRILFEVKDTGKGIPVEAQKTIFEPFKQDEEGLRKGGTGLGLAISKKHINKMGGEIKVESKPSLGTRFYFSIPLHPSNGLMNDLHGTYKNVLTVKDEYKIKALVVDDVKENRKVLSKFLKSINISVVTGKNGEEALDKVKAEDPDIVFLDIHMPVMDGVEAFNEIKKQYPDKDLKLICITASAFGEQLKEYMKMGFDAFISKPFKTEEILSIFEELLKVEYVYRETKKTEESAPSYNEIDWSKIEIPQEIKERILKHARLYSITDITKDIDELIMLNNGKAKPVADYLKKCLKKYDMTSIANCISKLES